MTRIAVARGGNFDIRLCSTVRTGRALLVRVLDAEVVQVIDTYEAVYVSARRCARLLGSCATAQTHRWVPLRMYGKGR